MRRSWVGTHWGQTLLHDAFVWIVVVLIIIVVVVIIIVVVGLTLIVSVAWLHLCWHHVASGGVQSVLSSSVKKVMRLDEVCCIAFTGHVTIANNSFTCITNSIAYIWSVMVWHQSLSLYSGRSAKNASAKNRGWVAFFWRPPLPPPFNPTTSRIIYYDYYGSNIIFYNFRAREVGYTCIRDLPINESCYLVDQLQPWHHYHDSQRWYAVRCIRR